MPAQPAAVPRPLPVPANAPRPVPIPAGQASDPTRLVFRTGEEDGDDQLKLVARYAPAWLISCVVHLTLLVVLGLWYITTVRKPSGIFLDVQADDYGEQLIDNTVLENIGKIQADEPFVTPNNLEQVDDPFAPDPSAPKVTLDGAAPTPPILQAPSISIALAGREEGTKELLLGKYGGTKESQDAVKFGLEWLARQQRKDGTWSLKGPYRSGAVNGRDIPESATAMALLAFQGAGHSHQKGEHKKQVAAGIKALLKMQGSDGSFVQEGASNHWFYAHGQCTMAVCELFGMTKDPNLRKPAEMAIQYCVASQEPNLGGWRYLPRTDSDTSVTGWIVMALQSARMAGLDVPSPVLLKVSEYLDKATPDGSRYSYQIDMEPTLTMTAEALLCRQYLGWKQDDPRLVTGVGYLTQNLPRYEDRDVYYWYYGTQVMHHMGGKPWDVWNRVLRDLLVDNQEKNGLEKGSWDPLGEHPDRWSNLGQGGRLYTTCLSLYMLEVYYRHLPIYGVHK
ncbi:MAG TPA: prenyltransferase/squalene oxidase repeat-containing protein [Pirellulales bacterium]|nr:prenyltransferase/squalene oxidase repeat-containing protein [Pirellulales bacterium]